ncbi:hypothetical protein QR680_007121 [Steinernema hermaphroditum]|uniref:Uncharacterized protein n=1 Tax=Steinernema hermaphroditum TaxID=289476 RepID=A0AA39HXT6_9BILA|nr:hypothetical protein QR680_007121 [Steinernema hermaphroditum]
MKKHRDEDGLDFSNRYLVEKKNMRRKTTSRDPEATAPPKTEQNQIATWEKNGNLSASYKFFWNQFQLENAQKKAKLDKDSLWFGWLDWLEDQKFACQLSMISCTLAANITEGATETQSNFVVAWAMNKLSGQIF